jgi:adenylate cyclase
MSGRLSRLRNLLLLGVAVLCCALGIVGKETDALRGLNQVSVDWRFDVRGAEETPSDVVLVALDDKTLTGIPDNFPFSRRYHARMVRQLIKAEPAAISYDVQFTEPDVDDPNGDLLLIEASRAAGNVVLASTEVDARTGKTNIFGGGRFLRRSRATPAYSNVPNDSDGRVRRMVFEVDKLQAFPLAAVRTARPDAPLDLPEGNSAWIDFTGPPGTIDRLSFIDVMRNEFDPEAVRGKIVVVGAVAPRLQDLHQTSTTGGGGISPLMPGPEVHANSIVTALRGFQLGDGPGWLDIVLVILLAFAAPLAAMWVRIALALALGVVVILALLFVTQQLFESGTIITFVYPVLAGALALILTAGVHGITVAFERERVRDAFARFVPESVVGEVLKDADGVRLGGVRRDATVLFSDLRGFTSFSETLDPAQVIDALNRYLTEMSEAILEQGGTLVAYMGDGIMAVFGAPLAQEDHADRALEASRDMLARLDGWNQWLRDAGLHEGFKMGIGLNSGPVMSGNVGSEKRLEYTALGDTTNTAARLEGMTKGTPYQLYVADSTRGMLAREVEDLIPVGDVEVRGRKAKVTLWSLRETEAAPAEPAAEPAAAPS